jgi:hypothetical protein
MKTKTKQEIINETVEYYKDASKRGYDEVEETCMYLTEGGNMCAVGRCLIPGSKMEMEVTNHVNRGEYLAMEDCKTSVMKILNLEEILKPEYRGHSIEFWTRLQNLHDSHEFYTDGTMNEKGLEHAKYLWREWEIDTTNTPLLA